MNEQQKLHINSLVGGYLETKSEVAFASIYEALSKVYENKLTYWEATTSLVESHDTRQMFDDVLLSVLRSIETNGGDFVKLFARSINNRFKSLLRKVRTRRNYETLESTLNNDEEDAATFEIVDEFNLEEEVIEGITRKKKNDQRQLIEFLVRGENERTTAIVQTYLSTDLKTPTAIGKHLGLDHKQVSRILNRLAGKFSTKQFGNYHDYLVAL